jgi:hypothetical protein
MSDEKKKAPPADEKAKAPKGEGELTDETLEGVSGGLSFAIPSVGGVSALPSRETSTCISQT